MPSSKLYAITDRGNEFELLTPFFEALLLIFDEGAKEMRIEPNDTGWKVTYSGKSLLLSLPDDRQGYGLIVVSRIQILSNLSISLEDVEQTGVFKVRYNDRILPINVTCRRGKKGWFLFFKFDAANFL